jgi:hypothetical protein
MAASRDMGLCGTCRYAPGCAFHRDHKFTVFHCEEFEFEDVPVPRIEERVRPAANPGVHDNPGMSGNAKYPGLCGDCENRASCMFAGPERCAWHCEEYR